LAGSFLPGTAAKKNDQRGHRSNRRTPKYRSSGQLVVAHCPCCYATKPSFGRRHAPWACPEKRLMVLSIRQESSAEGKDFPDLFEGLARSFPGVLNPGLRGYQGGLLERGTQGPASEQMLRPSKIRPGAAGPGRNPLPASSKPNCNHQGPRPACLMQEFHRAYFQLGTP